MIVKEFQVDGWKFAGTDDTVLILSPDAQQLTTIPAKTFSQALWHFASVRDAVDRGFVLDTVAAQKIKSTDRPTCPECGHSVHDPSPCNWEDHVTRGDRVCYCGYGVGTYGHWEYLGLNTKKTDSK